MLKFKPFPLFSLLLTAVVSLIFSCTNDSNTSYLELKLVKIGEQVIDIVNPQLNIGIETDTAIELTFSAKVDSVSLRKNLNLKLEDSTIAYRLSYSDAGGKSIKVIPLENIQYNHDYYILISNSLRGMNGESFMGITVKFSTRSASIVVKSIDIEGNSYAVNQITRNVDLNPTFKIYFTKQLDLSSINSSEFKIKDAVGSSYTPTVNTINDSLIEVLPQQPLEHVLRYSLFIPSTIRGKFNEQFNGSVFQFYTKIDSTPKYPVISDDDLLTLIQQKTFRYFWDFGHPSSGMARERDNSGDIVTIGGSGFGLMAIPVAIERGFITRTEGIERISTMVNFLKNADRFHGAWAHWYNGATGHVVPFSTYDNGGDLVETSYMAQALVTVRQYLNAAEPLESELISSINLLLDGIEWSWYNRDNLNMLSWHWSPTYGWAMNMFVRGWNEALITYIMAATSTTFPISAEVYHNGWARNGTIVNGRSFYGYTLPLGNDYGGPLFFAQYSFLGLNPHNLSDQYASYWTQNVNHSLINRQYCIVNPKGYLLYSPDCWGLTASDDNNGYGAHEPLNDNGTITPTAALSSMPYTPVESLKAARFFYYTLGDRLWGDYGFYDAFNPTAGWWGKSYLAIDQGPIIIMIENYRSGLCWNLFMSAPEVDSALSKLNFSH
jgi:hypothetical protein